MTRAGAAAAYASDLTLGLDTSTDVVVGLARGAEVLGRAVVTDRRAHAEQLTPLVHQVLAGAALRPADLGRIVVGLGPGPFTGLRVGIATARVLADVLAVPLHGVCSLDVIATQHADSGADGEFLVATDARRRELYWARYAADGGRLDGPWVSPPTDLPPLDVVGPGADLYPAAVESVLGPRSLDPGVLATHGPALPSGGEEPLYLRRPDAAEPTRRKSVLVRRAGER